MTARPIPAPVLSGWRIDPAADPCNIEEALCRACVPPAAGPSLHMMGIAGKPIVVSSHAAERMRARGATLAEVEHVIRNEAARPAKRGKWEAKSWFPFGRPSPVNRQVYRFKTVAVVFADQPHAVTVITVKVFYHD